MPRQDMFIRVRVIFVIYKAPSFPSFHSSSAFLISFFSFCSLHFVLSGFWPLFLAPSFQLLLRPSSPSLFLFILTFEGTHCETETMALDLHYEDFAAQTDAFGDKSCVEKWNSAPEAIADSDRDAPGDFECNICLDSLHDPVLTLCGHLYCWPCIYRWLHFGNASSQNIVQERTFCPVCKSEISQFSLVPVYGRVQITKPSKGKSPNVGTAIPPRPRGPVSVHDFARSCNSIAAAHDSSRSYNTASASRPATQFHQRPYAYHTQQLNAFDTTHGVFGQMIYARVFGNQLTNVYTSNSYGLTGNNNRRVRRHLMLVDKSLSRICFFIFCCTVVCLLLF
ncbi:E3 ubiquitin-protein ligase RMA1H1 isoform X1 [Neltuma alba]|uniref:E3 ubiquitin-protein ligase RMA1H1 isoform X1 n=2 Tax=Neltuma alba TaxID=207710 RepID=UPI0010A4872F|nr:E3 ubiquitin-protein ligase RMA1H1-like isoform X1 [Prosopis alba]